MNKVKLPSNSSVIGHGSEQHLVDRAKMSTSVTSCATAQGALGNIDFNVTVLTTGFWPSYQAWDVVPSNRSNSLAVEVDRARPSSVGPSTRVWFLVSKMGSLRCKKPASARRCRRHDPGHRETTTCNRVGGLGVSSVFGGQSHLAEQVRWMFNHVEDVSLISRHIQATNKTMDLSIPPIFCHLMIRVKNHQNLGLSEAEASLLRR